MYTETNEHIDLEKYFKFHPFNHRNDVVSAVLGIGKGREISLVFDVWGKFMICGDDRAYYPKEQGMLTSWVFESYLTVPKDCIDIDWHERAADELLHEIVKIMEDSIEGIVMGNETIH
jgi:hypothetical protein